MSGYLVQCAWADGTINYRTEVTTKAEAERTAKLCNDRQACSLEHVVLEVPDNATHHIVGSACVYCSMPAGALPNATRYLCAKAPVQVA